MDFLLLYRFHIFPLKSLILAFQFSHLLIFYDFLFFSFIGIIAELLNLHSLNLLSLDEKQIPVAKQ